MKYPFLVICLSLGALLLISACQQLHNIMKSIVRSFILHLRPDG